MKIFTILLLLLSLTSKSQDILYRAYDPSNQFGELGDKVGYVDRMGKFIIPLGKYPYCYSETFDRIAFVGLHGKNGIFAIDRSQRVIAEVVICDNGPDCIREGLFRIQEGGYMGFADITGQIIIAAKYDLVLPFSENRAAFCIGGYAQKNGEYTQHMGGKWGFLDRTGKKIIDAIYDQVYPFKNGSAIVKKNGKWGCIDEKGKIIIPLIYESLESIKNEI